MTSGNRIPDLEAAMRFDPFEGILDLEDHMARLKDAAARAGLAFDRHAVRNELHAATFRLIAPAHVRVLVSGSGAVAIEVRPEP